LSMFMMLDNAQGIVSITGMAAITLLLVNGGKVINLICRGEETDSCFAKQKYPQG